jgi:hypothetical protein
MTNRIQSLPRRNWRDRAAEARQLNALLRAPGGAQSLHDIQAVSLLEAWECGGLVCYARVGAGKSLVIGLLPTLLAQHPAGPFTRPLIVVPGALRSKTESEFAAMRQHWRVAHQYWLESYTALAQVSRADILDERQPDVLLFDEPDALRRITSSSVAKRVGRYIAARRAAGKPTFCGFFHATPYRNSILDFAHMVGWALGERSPLPTDALEVQQWSAWLDDEDAAGRAAFRKYFPGVDADVERAEDAFRERFASTPGVILSDDTFDGADLEVTVHRVDPGLDGEFAALRDLMIKPDGWQLLDRSETKDPDEVNTWSVWGVARQLACGFFYKIDPAPPREWMAARKAYADYVRKLIDAPNSRYDTELQVRQACQRAAANGRKVHEWAEWERLKDTFIPRSVPVWVSTHALEAAKAWGARGPGVVWTDHLAFGERLAAETGWSFYGQSGLDANGGRIEDARPDRPLIASRLANQRGRNLQTQFSRNLIMAMPNIGADLEQLLGRTHRYGQVQSKVTVDVYCACAEHLKSLDVKVPKSSRKTSRLLGLTQKIEGVRIVTIGDIPSTSRAWG